MEQIKKIDIHAHATAFPQYAPKFANNGCTMPSVDTMLDFYDKLNIEKGVLLPIVSPEAQLLVMTPENCKYIADNMTVVLFGQYIFLENVIVAITDGKHRFGGGVDAFCRLCRHAIDKACQIAKRNGVHIDGCIVRPVLLGSDPRHGGGRNGLFVGRYPCLYFFEYG